MAAVPKLTHRFNGIPVKIPIGLLPGSQAAEVQALWLEPRKTAFPAELEKSQFSPSEGNIKSAKQ